MWFKKSLILVNLLKFWQLLIVEDYEPKTKVEIENKKKVISVLNEIRKAFLDYYLDPNTVVELHKNISMIK